MKREAGGLRIARLLLFPALLAALPARAAGPDEALARARAARLWEDPQWVRLGHYKPTRWLGRTLSDAATSFFVVPAGTTDPRAELEAEVAGLYAPDPGGGRASRCRFPARAAWLTERLGLDPASLPSADCSRFEDWRRLMDAGSVSLIFASAYLNNPSSMFGHTFLRLERRATGGDPLRDNTLNFAADTGNDGGALFAAKGLLGLYPGAYTAMPYYMKVAEYNDIEDRDLWEYRLALSSAEVDRLVAHAWEMGRTEFPYYFFSKNCSYQLMPALEAAAPRLSLLPGSPPVVAPADVVRAVMDAPGLVSEVRYRPSHASDLSVLRARTTRRERRAAAAYADAQVEQGDALSAGLAPERKVLVLDAAEDLVLYEHGFAPDAPPEVRALERPILIRRARLDAPAADPPARKDAAPPQEGHLRHRFWVGAGVRRGGSFTELSWRPGYHDFLERPRGYEPSAAIWGMAARLRYDAVDRRVYLRDGRIAEILSAAPWDGWTRKPAWGTGTGFETAFELGKPASRSLVYEGHLATGLAARPLDSVAAYALAGVAGAVGSPLRDGWRGGGDLRGGLAWDAGPQWRAVLEGGLSGFVLGDRTPNRRLQLDVNWAPARDLALRVEGLWRGHHREAGLYAIVYR